MLLDHSYGKAVERLKVWWQEIVLCTTRTGALPCLSLPMDAGASFLYVCHAKNGGRFDAGFRPGLPAVAIVQETRIEPKPVLPALTSLRLAFQPDIPHLFSSTVEIDET